MPELAFWTPVTSELHVLSVQRLRPLFSFPRDALFAPLLSCTLMLRHQKRLCLGDTTLKLSSLKVSFYRSTYFLIGKVYGEIKVGHLTSFLFEELKKSSETASCWYVKRWARPVCLFGINIFLQRTYRTCLLVLPIFLAIVWRPRPRSRNVWICIRWSPISCFRDFGI